MPGDVSIVVIAALALASPASASDWIVDATGSQSSFTTIDQAMVQSTPGDRILVLPGSYPAFHFGRGVEVIGMGSEPSEVVVARVDFHVNIPIDDFDAVLSNLRVCGSGAADAISITGNELAAGTFLIDRVETCGGVFLRGVPGFYLLVNDCDFAPGANGGFANAAFDFAGGTADFVGSSVTAWDASVANGAVAAIALRAVAGSSVRASGSTFVGGNGVTGGSTAQRNGAAGIASSGATDVGLRLAGGSVVEGGDGVGGGNGGDGVRVNGTIVVGDASVSGGLGIIPGLDYGIDLPTLLSYDPQLLATPSRAPQSNHGFSPRGIQVVLDMDTSTPTSASIAWAEVLDPPASSPASPLPPGETSVHAGDQLELSELVLWSGPPALSGSRHVFQGFFMDPDTKALVATNPVVLDLAP